MAKVDRSGTAVVAPPLLDREGIATLVAGSLLILISFTTNYGYGDITRFFNLGLDEQIGLSLHLAALAALFGDVELATRLRDRTRDRNAQREQRQNRALRAGALFLLDPSPLHRRFLAYVAAELANETLT
jgi:hypothetical protein